MANKTQAYLQMSQLTAAQITSSYQKWTDFPSTAGRLYKYPFPEGYGNDNPGANAHCI